MTDQIVSQSPNACQPDELTDPQIDAIIEWFLDLEDGTTVSVGEISLMFEIPQHPILCSQIFNIIEDEHPGSFEIESLIFRTLFNGSTIAITWSVKRVNKILGHHEKNTQINWQLWLKILEFHRAQPVGAKYGYAELSGATGAVREHLVRLGVLDQIHDHFTTTTELVKLVPPGGTKPFRMVEIIGNPDDEPVCPTPEQLETLRRHKNPFNLDEPERITQRVYGYTQKDK